MLSSALAVVVLPGLLGTLDPFSLSLPDDVPLKLGKRSQHLKQELGERILCAVVLEGQSLRVKFHGHALGQQGVEQDLEVLQPLGQHNENLVKSISGHIHDLSA